MMGKKVKGRRTGSPPQGECWIWHTLELRRSKAWQGRSIGCIKLIEFLELEHLQHGANDNGRLHAPYSQLVAFGISRKAINPAILEAEARGLIKVNRGGLKGRTLSEMNTFTLSYAWTRVQSDGVWFWTEPTDDWQRFEGVFARQPQKTKSKAISAQKGTDKQAYQPEISTQLGTISVPKRELPNPQVIDIATPDRVPNWEHPSISGQGTDILPSSLHRLNALLDRKGGQAAPVGSAVGRPPLPTPRSNPPNRPMHKQVHHG